MCRKCDVRGEDAGNPNIVCHRIVQQDIVDLVEAEDHERLGELNQYCVDNAWYKVNFGGCKYGIFSAACPIEPLHAIENGIIPDCIKILYHEYIKSSKDLAKLDDLVQQLTELPNAWLPLVAILQCQDCYGRMESPTFLT